VRTSHPHVTPARMHAPQLRWAASPRLASGHGAAGANERYLCRTAAAHQQNARTLWTSTVRCAPHAIEVFAVCNSFDKKGDETHFGRWCADLRRAAGTGDAEAATALTKLLADAEALPPAEVHSIEPTHCGKPSFVCLFVCLV
jgi:hypothetical protein